MITSDELRSELTHFIGTEHWYQTEAFPWYTFTDGVRFFIEQTNSPWLLKVADDLKAISDKHRFLVMKFEVKGQDILYRLEDGNDNEVTPQVSILQPNNVEIPDGEWVFWFIDQVMIVPSEY